MSAPVATAASQWTLFACVEADGWHGAVRDTWQTDEVTDDAVGAVAEVCEDGAALRVVAPDGPRPLLVVVGGRACPLALPDDVREYLGTEAYAAWAADPVAWWREHADGRHLLRVAGAAVRSQGSPLHRHVVRAACA